MIPKLTINNDANYFETDIEEGDAPISVDWEVEVTAPVVALIENALMVFPVWLPT
jgi:hypothetical protein